jgi:hypothetical protein
MQAVPAELQKLIEDHIRGFNTQDDQLLLSVFADSAVVIDGIAPYLWPNPDGPARWLADAAKWRANLGVTSETFVHKMGFWNVEGDAAYAVVEGVLTIVTKAQTIVRTGLLAYTFARRNGVWKLNSQAWARTS